MQGDAIQYKKEGERNMEIKEENKRAIHDEKKGYARRRDSIESKRSKKKAAEKRNKKGKYHNGRIQEANMRREKEQKRKKNE